MIIDLNKFPKFFKKKIELMFLFLLVLITIVSTTFYNNNKILIVENYKDVIGNIYFQKSVKYIFDNLKPRYKNTTHKISKLLLINFVIFLKLNIIFNFKLII